MMSKFCILNLATLALPLLEWSNAGILLLVYYYSQGQKSSVGSRISFTTPTS